MENITLVHALREIDEKIQTNEKPIFKSNLIWTFTLQSTLGKNYISTKINSCTFFEAYHVAAGDGFKDMIVGFNTIPKKMSQEIYEHIL